MNKELRMIRLINTTTRLPVDQALEDFFFRLIKPAYSNAVLEQRHRRHYHIDVQFVSKDDLDLDRKRLRQIEDGLTETDREEEPCSEQIPDMDLLGVYFSHHPDYHRPVIKVSPEKVMAACQRLKTKTDIKLPLAELYPTLLHAVVIHEVAHSLMDNDSSRHHCDTPWSWLADCLDEEPKEHYLENIDHYFDAHCHRYGYRNITIPKLRQWQHVIEESLANAFVLKQGFNAEQLAALTLFITNQPYAYKVGLKWKCTMPKLLETAESWRSFKGHFLDSNWDLIYSETDAKSSLEVLVDRLNEAEYVGSYNFEREFKRHLISRLPVWQAAFEQGDKKWGEFLNETFGVLFYLVHFFDHKTKPTQRLKFLKQWASNGSAKAIDDLNKTLSEASMKRGDFQKALDYQRARRTNLPKLDHNEYWNKKYSEEIETAISELSAMG
jgi:hypothetical protein